jgi:hypothetical protein
MAEGSPRGGRSSTGLLLLAVIFLAVLGAGAGYSLGTLARGEQTGTGQSGSGTTGGGSVTQPPGGTTTTQSALRCPAHTEDQANAGPLTQVFYLRTTQSEVWVCKAADGTLFYQGHKGQPGDPMDEGRTALFLRSIETEGSNGWVATNTDPNNGNVTRYHVTKDGLDIEYVWSGRHERQPAVSS